MHCFCVGKFVSNKFVFFPGQNFCMFQIKELSASPGHIESDDLIQNIIMFLHRCEGLSKHVDAFIAMLSLVQMKEKTPFILSPMFSDPLSESGGMRSLDISCESSEHDFNTLLAEIQKEISMDDIIRELGYGCTLSGSHCKEILSLYLPLNEVSVARIISTIVRTHTGLEDSQTAYATFCSALCNSSVADSSWMNSWNIDVLLDSIKQIAPETNWKAVMENLDHEGFYLPDEKAFLLLMSIYRNACQDPFPLSAVTGVTWKNAEGQLSFLKYAIPASPEIFTFSHAARQLSYMELPQGNRIQQIFPNMSWMCLDLLQVLCELAEKGHAGTVRALLEHPLKHCPELLLLGVAQIKTAFNLIQFELSSTIFPMLLANDPKSSGIHQLWLVNRDLVLRGFIDIHDADPDSALRILEICHDLKILHPVLGMSPFSFGIKLAALASKKEYLDLEKWLNENLNIYKDTFFEVLQAHSGHLVSRQLPDEMKRLHAATIHANPRGGAADSSSPEGYPDDIEAEANSYFHQLFAEQLSMDAMIQMLARFSRSSDSRELAIFDCMIHNLFDEYKFFQKYPERQLKITAVLFGEGSLIKHQLVSHLTLGVALRFVLDSLRKSVDSKMFLFGSIALEQFMDRLEEWAQYCNHILQISHLRATHPELVSYIERILARISSSQSESIGGNSASSDQPQNNISLEATETAEMNVSSTVQSLPQVSSQQPLQQRHPSYLEDRHKASNAPVSLIKPLLSSSVQSPSIPNNVDLVTGQKSTASQSSQSVPSLSSSTAPTSMLTSPGLLRSSRGLTPAGVLRQTTYNTGFGAALNIETLVAAAERRETPIEAPPSEVQDKIFFMINNISVANVEIKAKEFIEILKEQYYPWFAQYMVMKRASIEPNFHDLYLKFLDKVNSKSLNKEIVKATYENCKVLLRSELIKSSSEERSLLKNLGSWLGKFTIGRNQALRAREIDPKQLIIEAYEKGLMIAVIPFTSKILEPCQSSLAYQPPNPWTMGILGLLAEIYALPNLKMNLKFDIEYAGSLHLSSSTLGEDEKIGNLGLTERIPSAQGISQVAPTQAPFSVNQLSMPIPNLGTHVIINPKLNPISQQLQLPRIVPLSMERAMREIISPVVERSVNIACMTTKELVSKDYAMESDESRTHNAANLMVASLAGSLAHVTCKEPLRLAISNQLRNYLPSVNMSNIASDVLEQVAQIVTNDNLDLGCALIEQVATDKALQRIENEFAELLSLRRKQRENLNAAFYEASTYSQGTLARLPEALRPKPGRLSAAQQRVYEDFTRFPWQNQPSQSSNAISSAQPASSGGFVGSGLSRAYVTSSVPINSSIYSTTQLAAGFGSTVQPPDHIPEELDTGITCNPGTPDPATQSITEASSFASAALPAVPTEVHPGESANSIKDSVPSLQPSLQQSAAERLGASMSEPLTTGDALDKYEAVAQKVLIAEVPEIILRCVSKDEAAMAIAQKVFKSLYEHSLNSVLVSSNLAILVAIRDVCKLVVKELTSWVIYSDEERKYNKDIIFGLIRSELLNLAEYNVHLAKLIDGGKNKPATDFAIALVQSLVAQELGVSASEFQTLLDALGKLSMRTGLPESLQQLVEIARNPSNAASQPTVLSGSLDKAKLIRDKKVQPLSRAVASREGAYPTPTESVAADSAAFREQVAYLFTEWGRVCESPGSNEAAYLSYLSQLQQRGILKGDDVSDSFFRILMEIAVSHCLNLDGVSPSLIPLQGAHHVQNLSFTAVDMYAKLVFLLVKFYASDQGSNKIMLFPKVLTVTVRFIQKDAEERKAAFNPRPYYRLFINWIFDFNSTDPILDAINFQVLFLYKGTLRVLLVLLHDFPEFLCDYHFSFCDVIPPSCIQMRNVILSAFPRNMRLPDPFTPNLKVDLLPEISQPPRILSDVDGALKVKQMKAELDEYLKTRQPGSTFLTELKQRLLLPQAEASLAGTRYNVPLINSLVLYVGMQEIQQMQSKSAPQQLAVPTPRMTNSAYMDIFQKLIVDLDTEGRYLFLNAVANQLRYPNNHTHFFSCVLLFLFAEANQDIIQEQITRVLLERLIVNRPHPWGLLITFIELIKNPLYNFWNRSFTRCAPEIEKLFDSVARSCGGPAVKAADDSLVSGPISDNSH
ncbi:CCR4-NOT transcription complex subunit 1 [Nymphaea thermarum]|nr:CCR4-NOT transcription complex subunit 1 [Nymphaea thermarum]